MSTESLRTSWNRIQNLLDEFCPEYDEKLIIDKLQLRICNRAWTTQDCIRDFINFKVPSKPFLFQILCCKKILKRKWDKSRIKEIIIIIIIIIKKGEEHDLTVRSLIRIGLFPAILWRANSLSRVTQSVTHSQGRVQQSGLPSINTLFFPPKLFKIPTRIPDME